MATLLTLSDRPAQPQRTPPRRRTRSPEAGRCGICPAAGRRALSSAHPYGVAPASRDGLHPRSSIRALRSAGTPGHLDVIAALGLGGDHLDHHFGDPRPPNLLVLG